MTSTSSTTSHADPGRDAREVDEAAIRRFRAEHSGLQLAPVVVVIPALNEEACIGDVLAAISEEACGLALDTLVGDDGSSDGTRQGDPADVPAVLQPVVDDEADLALGSRVLGRAETDDVVRGLGVRVFSVLARVLTGTAVSDTSTGLRAMKAA